MIAARIEALGPQIQSNMIGHMDEVSRLRPNN